MAKHCDEHQWTFADDDQCPTCEVMVKDAARIAELESKLDDALRHLSIERQAYNDLARLRTEAESRLAAVIKERDEFGRLCKDSQGFADSVVKRLNAAESRLDAIRKEIERASEFLSETEHLIAFDKIKAIVVERRESK